MKKLFEEKVWIVMSKDRKVVAKGTPRNRELVFVDDLKDKKRFLTYSSKCKAEAAFKDSFFYQPKGVEYDRETKRWKNGYYKEDMEAVQVIMSLNIIS